MSTNNKLKCLLNNNKQLIVLSNNWLGNNIDFRSMKIQGVINKKQDQQGKC